MKKKYLETVFKCYDSQKYLNYSRWDDGYIFRMIMEKHYKYKGFDVTKECRLNNVISHGPFRGLITHEKGLHRKLEILV